MKCIVKFYFINVFILVLSNGLRHMGTGYKDEEDVVLMFFTVLRGEVKQVVQKCRLHVKNV